MAADKPSPLELAGLRFQISILEEALRADRNDTETLRYLAHAYIGVGQLEDGLAIDRRLVELLPTDPRVRYNLACSCALSGRAEEALEVLGEACALGFDDLALLRRDSDLDGVREDPRYRQIEGALAERLGGE
ncbi:MAG: TPR end-of-group domain-containing protein [Planctomycetota bacterium]|jgi:tetratricopeptide (TPR) repeat protein